MPKFMPAVRRKVFVSYHHKGDQAFYDAFARAFHDTWEAVADNSLERMIDSDDPQYVMRRIREEHLTGSSCLIVLCGAATPERKFVDWEILAALNQRMGLVGVGLPGIKVFPNGGTGKPPRLQDNIDCGYAEWTNWGILQGDAAELPAVVERANAKSALMINNTRSRMLRNLP